MFRAVDGLKGFGWPDPMTRMVAGSYAANLAGASFIFVYLEFIAPIPPRWRTETVRTAVRAVVLLVFTAGIQNERTNHRCTRSTVGIHEGRAPTPAERLATLTLPWRSTIFSIISWGAGAVTFATWAWVLHSSWLF